MRFRSTFSHVIFVLTVFAAIGSVTVLAQGRATVFGTATDSTGALVPSVSVTLANASTGQAYTTSTTSDGSYVIPSVVPGVYSLTASAQGFKTFVAQNITIQVDENRQVPIQLAIGSTSEEVTVSTDVAQVDTRTVTITEVVDAERVKDLPLNGRNPLDLQQLVAGAAQVAGAGQGENNTISINGNRQNANNYTLDGADNEDPFFNSPSVVPNPDALDQFSMKTSNYGAQEGRNAGAQMNAIIKSGANKFHGVLFEYLRNQAFDAAGYFASSRAPYRRSQFGGTFGGPILRDRLFFFFAYQGTRQNSTPSVLNLTVPSAAERTGNFAELLPGKQLTIPGTKTIAPNNNLTPYLNPAAVAFMNDFVPLPNAPGNSYNYAPASKVYEDQYVGKLDSAIRNKDTLSGHLIFVTNKNTQVPNNTNLPGFLAQVNYTNWHVAVNETHTFSTHLVNLFTFGFNDIQRYQLPVMPKQVTWADLGSGIVRAVPGAPIGSDTQVKTYFTALSRWPLTQLRAEFQYSDVLNWIFGNHNLMLGGDIRQQYTDQTQSFQSDAQVVFQAGYTGNQLGDFLTGRPNSIKQQSFNHGMPANTIPDLFVQDDWKATRRLTLNLGLRWEPFIPLHDRLGQLEQFRPGVQSVVLPHAPLGYVFPGDPGVPRDTYPTRYATFAPRIGFAYDVFGDGKTSLRGGIGIYDGNIRTQSLNGSSTDVPYSQTVTISSPTGGLNKPYADLGAVPFPFNPPARSEYPTYIFPTPLAISDFNPGFRGSRVTQWNLNLQQQLPWQIISTIAYVGTNGEHLDVTAEMNPALATKAGKTTDSRRIYAPNFSSIQRSLSGGHSSYHSLQATLNKRLSHGVTVLANYTWAKSIDNGSAFGNQFLDPFNYRLSRGLSDFDIPNTFVTSFIWKIPGSRGNGLLTRTFVKGWDVNGIIHLNSGSPFGVGSGVDNSLSGVNADMADRVGPLITYRGTSKQQQIAKYFNTSAFVPNAIGTFGNSGRNIMIGPGYSNMDFGFMKAFPTPELFHLIFRAEAFNVFNHANLAGPVTNLSSTTFGQITSQQGDPRVIQVALRLEF